MDDTHTQARIPALVDTLGLAGIDVEPARCDPHALRLTALEMAELADLLDAREAS